MDPIEVLLEVADILEPEAAAKIQAALAKIENVRLEEAIRKALRTGNRKALLEYLHQAMGPVWKQLQVDLTELSVRAITLVGERMAPSFGLSFLFNNPLATAWAANNTGLLISNISAESLTVVKDTIDELFRPQGIGQGLDVKRAGRRIRESIGLLPAHDTAVQNYRRTLESQNVAPAKVDELVDIYRWKLKGYRGQMIARTETIRASNMGLYMVWQQRIEKRGIDPATIIVKWTVTRDDRLCQYCAPMDGKPVPFGTMFTSDTKGFPPGYDPSDKRGPDKRLKPDPMGPSRDKHGTFAVKQSGSLRGIKPTEVLTPPLHPQCRCGLVAVWPPLVRLNPDDRA